MTGDGHDRNRLLRFRLGDSVYGIRLGYVSGLVEDGPVHPVSGTPEAVLGLLRSRGHLLTVLDLPALLESPVQEEEACLIRLNGSNCNTALRIPARVRMMTFDPEASTSSGEERPEREGEINLDGERVTLLNPTVFVSRLEMEIRWT